MREIESQLDKSMNRVTSSTNKLVEHRTVRYSIAISRILILLAVYGALVFIILQCKTTCDADPACNASASGDLSVVAVLSNITLNPANTPSSTEVTMNGFVSVSPTAAFYDHRFQLQQEKLKTIQNCKPMLNPISLILSEELGSLDELWDKDLLPPVVPVNRCPYTYGLCLHGGHCRPAKTANTTVIVRYKDGDNVKKEERQLAEHLDCSCQ